jgi:NADH-quinone oxidoreductase subunit E
MTTQSLIPDNIKAEINKWLKKYPPEHKQSALLTALQLMQDHNNGYLTDEIMNAVAEYLGIPPASVYEAATFYSMYELKPVGRHKICVCTNISCLLSGSDEIMAHLEKRLQIKVGETTPDGKFTLKSVECLAACVNAPMFQIGHHYYEHLTPEKVDEILSGLD